MTGWADTIWLTKQERIDQDYAVFGELSFDFTDKLTRTVGVRFFEVRELAGGLLRLRRRLSAAAPTYGEALPCIAPTPTCSSDGAPCTNLDKTTTEDGERRRSAT